MSKLGVALLGLDHWYSALSIAPLIAASDTMRLVSVAHDDRAKAEALARETGAELATSDYRAAMDRDDVAIVVAMYSTDRNVAVSSDAAAAGKHIIGVKPMAMDLPSADRLVRAVSDAGVTYLTYESSYRLAPDMQRIKAWIGEGRIGQPVRYSQSLHSSLPQPWPGETGSSWWLDPARVPGGAWLDHAIYAVDLARWLFDTDIDSATGTVANRRHGELAVEDYGSATFELACGATAVIEDTWTGERGFSMQRSEYIGSAGAIVDDTRINGRLLLRGDFGFDSWTVLEQQRATHGVMIDHMVDCLRDTAEPVTSAQDGRANLAACLQFYAAATRI